MFGTLHTSDVRKGQVPSIVAQIRSLSRPDEEGGEGESTQTVGNIGKMKRNQLGAPIAIVVEGAVALLPEMANKAFTQTNAQSIIGNECNCQILTCSNRKSRKSYNKRSWGGWRGRGHRLWRCSRISQSACVMWRLAALICAFTLENGVH